MFKKSRRKIVASILSVLVLLLFGTFYVIYLASYADMTTENRQLLEQYVDTYVLQEAPEMFLAMGAGLIAGMGYLDFAVLFTVVMCAAFLLYSRLDFGAQKNAAAYKSFTITIPEDLDYTGVFDDIFQEYTTAHTLVSVKTTNMGSLFRLTYQITLRDPAREKEMIDKLRCRNGNLEIMVSAQETTVAEL